MRILLLGDTHLGIARRFWKPPEGWTRAEDHLAAMARALAPALREEVDLVVHAGDVFDRSRPPPEAVARGLALLREAARRVPVVVLAGNHDRRGLRPSLGPGEPHLHVVDGPSQLRLAGLRLALVPHHRQAEDWAVAAREAARGGVDLLVTHQAFAGVRLTGFTFRVGRPAETLDVQHLPPAVPLVLSGHIHPRQTLSCGEVPVVYAGSTERTSFSEAPETKGTALVELGARTCWRFVDHPARPMVTVREEAHLDGVVEGSLVGMAPRELRRWAEPARARGGIVALPASRPRTPRAQLRLF